MDYYQLYVDGYRIEARWGYFDGIRYLWGSVPPSVWKFMQGIEEGKYYYQYVSDHLPRTPFKFILGAIHESKIEFEDHGNIR